MPIAVPVNARLHKKKDPTTTVEHAAQMLAELPDWLPDRQLHLCADGAYACRAGADLAGTHLTVRMKACPAAAVLTRPLTDFGSSTGSVGRSAAGLVLHSPDEGL